MMPMAASGDGRPTWRMPPMNMMPMAPGLEKELPPVAPFLAGAGLDPSTLPEAVPAKIVELPDGGSMTLTATLHGQRFLVLSRDDVPNANLVWKDTAIVPVGTTMDMLADMSTRARGGSTATLPSTCTPE